MHHFPIRVDFPSTTNDMTITEHICPERPSDQDIATLENWIHGKLPDDYKIFLKLENGGRPKPNKFGFMAEDGKTEESTVQYFFAIYDRRMGNLKMNFDRYRKRIPPAYLPIGVDPFGNVIALGTANQNMGKIYFWDHEKENDVPSMKNMSKIADSFSEFIQKLG